RLPVCTPEQVTAYVSKLIKYEQNPNDGDYAYLNRSIFIAADQMRDYSGVGEHVLLAQSLPVYVASDTIDLIEAPTGVADDPPYPLAGSSITKLSEGWGIVSLLIHGRLDGWVIRSNRYNQWPKSFVLTATGEDDTHGFLPNIPANGMPGLVYSIGCNNGAFDMDTPPFPSANPSVVTAFLAKPDGGAVAFVGYSRWGWVATSWQIEQAFLDYLYNVNNNPAEALRYAKLQSTYYRDECYGLNFNGDPEMKIWINAPRALALSVPETLPDGAIGFEVIVKADSLPLARALITVMNGDSIVAQLQTGGNGIAMIPIEYNFADTFTVFAHKDGFATVTKQLNPQLVLEIDDDVAIPKQFALYQNYPNPFNPTTAITFQVDRPATVTLEIYNVLGEKVSTAMQSQVTAGRHQVEWDGSSDAGQPVSSGIYFAKLQLDDRSKIIKMCLMK
ncbi:MAG: C25 family cysteine peptidase, partial [candidate division Zixibacteria bacterium]|nr:C25 family cysteine peptidase [candidate division Zixibacteria bacterium]